MAIADDAGLLDGWTVLFDWNGTLADDTGRAVRATNAVLSRRSLDPLLMSDFTARFCLPLRSFFSSLEVVDPTAAEREWNFEMRQHEPRARTGAHALLDELRAAGAAVGVISAAGIEAVTHDLQGLALTEAIDLVRGDVTDKTETLRSLHSLPCAYVGDTDYDIAAAQAAGYLTVAILGGYQDCELVLGASPDIVLTDLVDLPGHLVRHRTTSRSNQTEHHMTTPEGLIVDVDPTSNPWTSLDIEPSGRRFTFTVIGDRTGGARPGVFERGLACTDTLAPSFAIQLGDLIEGYTNDQAELDDQWNEMDGMLDSLRTPMFHITGNHDVSTPLMADVWEQRYGRRYYHFRYQDVLFCLLDTQDPPFDLGEEALAGLARFEELQRRDPVGMRATVERGLDWEGTQPGTIGEEQHTYFEQVLRDNTDARWTVLCLHMPLWQGEHADWARLLAHLGDRPYTAFAGHVHNYQRRVIQNRDHIRLGPTGGLWVLGGPHGNFDHITQVTMTDQGPVIANVLLDGIRDPDGLPIHPVTLALVPIT